MLAAVATWPLVTRFSDHIIGYAGGDVWDHLWSMHGTARALGGGPETLLFRPYAYYPVGLALFPLNLAAEVVSVPFQWVMGLVAAFNLGYIVQFVFSGWATYRLARLTTSNPLASFVAGVIFAFSPYALSILVNGTVESGHLGWIPLYLWALLRCERNSASLRPVLLAAGVFLLTIWFCWYHGVFCALATLLYAGVMFISWPKDLRQRLLFSAKLFLLLVVAAVGLLHLCLFIRATLQHPDGVFLASKADYIDRALEGNHSAGFAKLFWIGSTKPSYEFAHLCYLGVSVLALAAWGMMRGKMDRVTRVYWGSVAAVFVFLSFGPVVGLSGGGALRLPYYYAMLWVPFFHYFEFPFRFIVVAYLALAVLAAFGLARILERLASRSSRVVLASVVCISVFGEYLASARWPLPMSSATIPAVYSQIRDAVGEGAVLELPLRLQTRGRYFYNQTVHGRPIPLGINTMGSGAVAEILSVTDLALRWSITGLSDDQLASLAEIGIKVIVWHPELQDDEYDIGQLLREKDVPILSEDSNRIVFDISSCTRTPDS